MPLVAIIVLAVVVALVLAGATAWWLGYPLRAHEAWRASATEAGERTAELAADFWDWVKLGS